MKHLSCFGWEFFVCFFPFYFKNVFIDWLQACLPKLLGSLHKFWSLLELELHWKQTQLIGIRCWLVSVGVLEF